MYNKNFFDTMKTVYAKKKNDKFYYAIYQTTALHLMEYFSEFFTPLYSFEAFIPSVGFSSRVLCHCLLEILPFSIYYSI